MKSFVYQNPVQILFGCGMRNKLADLVRGKYKRVLFVCAKGPFRSNGTFNQLAKLIEDQGIELYQMQDIDQNPRLSSAREGAAICLKNNIDCVIALGGGSAMDCSKLIAASGKTGIDPYEYVFGSRPKVEASLDTIMIPTIAATGTECNNSSVIVNDETKEKYYCDVFFPVYTILDPELTSTVPYNLLVWGAMDILSHTFEYYFNGYNGAEFQTCFSEAIIKAVMAALNKLSINPADIEARGELMYCAVMAWGGLTKIGRGEPDMTCHSIEESFSGYFDTHHGGCLGVLTPRWMERVFKDASGIFSRFARNVMGLGGTDDIELARAGVEAYKKWMISIKAPVTYFDLSSRSFTDEELNHVAETAFRIYHGKIGRLKAFDLDEIKKLLLSGKIPYGDKKEVG